MHNALVSEEQSLHTTTALIIPSKIKDWAKYFSVNKELNPGFSSSLTDCVIRGFMYKSTTYPSKAESDYSTQVRFQQLKQIYTLDLLP